ncbi:MAG: LptE family protein [Bacteroidales bacterium]
MIWLKRSLWMLTLASLLALQACNIYSFTGASIPAEAETVTINYFPNNASLVNANLSPTFTNKLKDRFQSQTNLNLTGSGGDLFFEGEIVEYKTNPVAIQGNDQAAMNRLTISVKVKFQNRYDEESNFETTFTRHEDFDSNLNLSSVEDQLVDQIAEKLVDDIFNESVVNW